MESIFLEVLAAILFWRAIHLGFRFSLASDAKKALKEGKVITFGIGSETVLISKKDIDKISAEYLFTKDGKRYKLEEGTIEHYFKDL